MTSNAAAPPTDQQASHCLLLPDPQPARGTGRALASFVDFEVEFEGALRLRVAGAGPTVVVARLSEAEEPDVGPQDGKHDLPACLCAYLYACLLSYQQCQARGDALTLRHCLCYSGLQPCRRRATCCCVWAGGT